MAIFPGELTTRASTASGVALSSPAQSPNLKDGWWRRVAREPLLQFLALGAFIFLVAHVLEQRREAAQRQIVVDERLERRIRQLHETQSGFSPAPDQLANLVQEYVDDEVMYREALRMGLDQDDEIVRRRLIQKMQFLQRDLAPTETPTTEELQGYFEKHVDRFARPVSVRSPTAPIYVLPRFRHRNMISALRI